MKNSNMKYWAALAVFFSPLMIFSQNAVSKEAPSVFSNPLFNTLLVVIIFLLIVIAALSAAVKNLGQSELFEKKFRDAKGSSSKALTILFIFLALSSYSQNPSRHSDWSVGGLGSGTFFMMVTVILGEMIVIASLLGVIRRFTRSETEIKRVKEKVKEKTIFDKINASVEVEKEEEILLDHDYDGIRELDNNLPPWWINGFYMTVIFAIIYMIHYHGSRTGDLQAAEYAKEVKEAELAIEEHMKSSAGNVDETTVKMLTEASEIASGKDLFITSCSACHGKFGEGGVGPNLTDDYWLHGGSVKDVFKTIKYGWPDKGMKSWKEDLSPVQIAQVTSFIKTLRGSNPANGKEKQGELFVEESANGSAPAAPVDPNAVVSDTIKKK